VDKIKIVVVVVVIGWGSVECLVQDREKWRAPVNAAMNLQFP
jgi:hypothetical protein